MLMVERSVSRKVKGGKLVKVTVRSEGGRIAEVRITGDFFAHPEEGLEQVERELRGATVSEVRKTVESATGGVTLVGLKREDIIEMVEECLE
jgi:lipoate-protein ligase A